MISIKYTSSENHWALYIPTNAQEHRVQQSSSCTQYDTLTLRTATPVLVALHGAVTVSGERLDKSFRTFHTFIPSTFFCTEAVGVICHKISHLFYSCQIDMKFKDKQFQISLDFPRHQCIELIKIGNRTIRGQWYKPQSSVQAICTVYVMVLTPSVVIHTQ